MLERMLMGLTPVKLVVRVGPTVYVDLTNGDSVLPHLASAHVL